LTRIEANRQTVIHPPKQRGFTAIADGRSLEKERWLLRCSAGVREKAKGSLLACVCATYLKHIKEANCGRVACATPRHPGARQKQQNFASANGTSTTTPTWLL